MGEEEVMTVAARRIREGWLDECDRREQVAIETACGEGCGVRNQVVIDLQRRRQQREMDAIYRCIRRAVDVPERLIDDVLGPRIPDDTDWDGHDLGWANAMLAERGVFVTRSYSLAATLKDLYPGAQMEGRPGLGWRVTLARR